MLCFSLLVVSLDTTILNVALPTIADKLHASSTDLQWIVDAYSMVFGCLVLVGGGAADRYGRRLAFVGGLAIFGGGSAWSAFSGSVGLLIGARSVMGVGGALVMPATLAIITDMFREPDERRRAIGLWSATSGVGLGIGPLVGGWLLAHFWWGSVFLVNVPIAALGILGAFLVVPESRNEHARRPDLPGAALAISGLGLVLWGLIEAPSWGWSSLGVLASLIGGVSLLGLLVLWEGRSSHPLLRLDLLRRPRFYAASLSLALVMFGLFGAFFVLTQYLQFFLGYSPLQAGLRITPIALLLALASVTSPALVRRIGTKLVVAAGLGVCALGLWRCGLLGVQDGYLHLLPWIMLIGIGAGLSMPAATDSVMGSVPAEESAVAAGTNSTAIQVGGSFGVAVVGSVLATRYQDYLSAKLAGEAMPEAIRHAILGSLGGALGVASHLAGPLGSALAAVARLAFMQGVDVSMAVAAAVAAGGALLALVRLPSGPAAVEQPEAAEGADGDVPSKELTRNSS